MALLRSFSLELDTDEILVIRETDFGAIELRKTGSRSRIILSDETVRQLLDVLNELS